MKTPKLKAADAIIDAWLSGPTDNGFKHCPFCGQPLTKPTP